MKFKDFERNKDGKKYYFFDHFSDLISLVENNRTNNVWDDHSENNNDPEFYGTETMDDAINFAKFGWSEGINKLNKEIKVYNTKNDYKNIYDITGSHVSVPRYLNGHPQNMIKKVQIPKRDNVINLVRFASVTGGMSGNRMIENGVKFVQVIQNLEAQGYKCNVDIVFASDHRTGSGMHEDHIVRIRIKNSNERLNISKMCFPLCHPSTFRRFVFKLRYMEYHTCNGFSSWNGGGRETEECMKKIKPFLGPNDYFVPLIIDDPETYELKKVA